MAKEIRIRLSNEDFDTLTSICTVLGTNPGNFFSEGFSELRNTLYRRYQQAVLAQTQPDVVIEVATVEE